MLWEYKSSIDLDSGVYRDDVGLIRFKATGGFRSKG